TPAREARNVVIDVAPRVRRQSAFTSQHRTLVSATKMPFHGSAPEGSTAAWVDSLQAAGRYTFNREELVGFAGRSPVAIEAALRRLKTASRIRSPRRGFFVIVPVEYRAAGCPPPSWFVADLMRFLDQPYYVGILS